MAGRETFLENIRSRLGDRAAPQEEYRPTHAPDVAWTRTADHKVEPEIEEPAEDVVESDLPSDIMELNEVVRERGLIGDVYFEFDQSNLSEEARQRLANNAQFMRENPEYVFRIEGHADERGTNDYNLALGNRRASSAADYLVSLTIDPSRLETLSYGEERPFCTESTESCWQRNRRAHFVITGRR